MNLLDVVKADHQSPKVKDQPNFKSGDTVAVHSRIKEGDKSRVQIFKGTVISIKKLTKCEITTTLNPSLLLHFHMKETFF